MIRRESSLWFLLCLCVPSAEAASRRGKPADFLNVGLGARAVALGEAYAAIAAGPEALFWNPGGLALAPAPQAIFQRLPTAGTGAVHDFAVGGPAGPLGWAAAFRAASPGTVAGFDAAGNPAGELTPRDQAFSAGLGGAGRGGSWGVAARLIRSRLVGSADAQSFGAGLTSPPLGRWRAGAAYFGGGHLTYDQEPEPIPSLARAGLVYRPKDFVTLSTDAIFPQSERAALGIGAEFTFHPAPGILLQERVGYNSRWKDEESGSGLCFGMGLLWRRIALDYALRLQGGWNAHVFTFSFAWGTGAREARLRRLLQDAQGHLRAGRPYEAILKFNEALELDPENAGAREGIRAAADAARSAP